MLALHLTFPHDEVAGFDLFSSPANSSASPQVLRIHVQ